MSSPQYSQDEIEKKRLKALEKRKEALLKAQKSSNLVKVQQQNQNTWQNKGSIQHVVQSTTYRHGKNSQQELQSSRIWQENKHSQQTVQMSTIGSKCSLHNSKNSSGLVNGPIRLTMKNNRYNPIKPQKFFGKPSDITGKCSIISPHRFIIELSDFVSVVIDTFKTIPSRQYDVNTKIWNFHINDYDNLMEKLLKHHPNLQLIPIPKPILEGFKNNLNSDNEIPCMELSEIESTLRNMLMPFQREGICFGISKNGRCMIADDMGLGKTIQALGIASYFRNSWPLLIVTPSSVRYQWTEAIYSFLPSIPAQYVQQFMNTKDFIGDNKIVIVSYDLLVRAVDTFKKYCFKFVILDESHALKSNKTARFKAVERIVSDARHIILLTGTPALSRPLELYSQISLIMPNFMKFHEFGIRYCAGKRKQFGWDFSGSSNMQELQIFLKITCMIRRLKCDVLNELPSKIRQVIILDPHLIKVGTKEMKEMSDKLERKTISGIEKHNALLQYYNESSFARLKAVRHYVTHLFENKQKFIIFAHHQNVIDTICELAESMQIKYIRIDGTTSSEQRKYLVSKFQEKEDCWVAVLSITAANAGINLTAAQLVVFAELFWNPGILCQAEDRAHRIGQNNSVLIQYLVAKNTADDYLWPMIQQKTNILSEVGLDQNLSLQDVNVKKQILTDKIQLKIDSFMGSSQKSQSNSLNEFRTNDEKEQHNASLDTELQKNTSAVVEDNFKELLNLDEEELENCDLDSFI